MSVYWSTLVDLYFQQKKIKHKVTYRHFSKTCLWKSIIFIQTKLVMQNVMFCLKCQTELKKSSFGMLSELVHICALNKTFLNCNFNNKNNNLANNRPNFIWYTTGADWCWKLVFIYSKTTESFWNFVALKGKSRLCDLCACMVHKTTWLCQQDQDS